MPLSFFTLLFSGAFFLFLFLKWKEGRLGRPIFRGYVFDRAEVAAHRFTFFLAGQQKKLAKKVRRYAKMATVISKLLVLWGIDKTWQAGSRWLRKMKLRERAYAAKRSAERKIKSGLPPSIRR